MAISFDLGLGVQEFDVELFCDAACLSADLDVGISVKKSAPEYQGAYSITPSASEQTFMTKGKIMKENMTVQEIPYVEVSNASNGVTVTIG